MKLYVRILSQRTQETRVKLFLKTKILLFQVVAVLFLIVQDEPV